MFEQPRDNEVGLSSSVAGKHNDSSPEITATEAVIETML